MTTYERKRAALRFANRIRRMLGLEPVTELRKGLRQDSTSCPIARTIKYQAGGRRYVSVTELRASFRGPDGARKHIPVPLGAQYFIGAFDAGEYRDLVAKR